ncbi:hypothetical protein HanXRQr2_Chr01g0033651 [Helianthus annuus]|uniref:Uncharacterized protein n=1 Tax=Helianthus annuus TaxID=4232 RepID=A0A9K3JWK4_HELAN|nr:hypothetical protein HanXRQr2_Chr01g0033651 [Helianthus annuus]
MCLASDHTWISGSFIGAFLDLGPALLLNSHSWSSRPHHGSSFGTESICVRYFVSGCGGFFLGTGTGAALLTTAGGGFGCCLPAAVGSCGGGGGGGDERGGSW